MKKSINTLQEALVFQLERLLYSEKKVKEEFCLCRQHIVSDELKEQVDKYIDSVNNKLLKLERVFSYLMHEPTSRRNEITDKLINETQQTLCMTGCTHLKDIVMIGCIQNINAYKISSYKTAYTFAAELELDNAADLLHEILEWEITIGKKLSIMSIEEFNKIQQMA